MTQLQPDHSIARRFLRRVWGEQLARLPERVRDEHVDLALYGFLSQKNDDGSWTDKALEQTPPTTHVRLPSHSNNLYYSINLFTEQRRLKRFVPGGCWLYADLDDVDPRYSGRLEGLRPTLAIESSPGRFQGLWLLDRWLNTRRLADLNQQLTYYSGADKGNWKMTQVLRVPGTISTKYETPHLVRLLWAKPSTLVYTSSAIRETVGDAETPQTATQNATPLTLPRASAQRLLARYSQKLPVKAKKLARTKTVLGSEDRSARLWELECLLLEAGMKPEEAFVVIKDTPWNKWQDSPDRGHGQLWTEITKASNHVKTKKNRTPPRSSSDQSASTSKASATQKTSGRKSRDRHSRTKDLSRTLITLNDFLLTRLPKPSWLVEGVWSNTAHGLLAGEAKTYKSLLSMDLSVSVASGTPFLNRFPVPKPGPVIIIQEENDASDMHDRLLRITASRGFAPKAHTANGRLHFDRGEDLPVHLLNRQGFRLNEEEDLEYLSKWATAVRPALIILDPLYLMTPGLNTNEATDMTPVLNNLLRIKQAHDCGILLVHHFRKTRPEERSQRAASRIAGSSVFHRWLASAVYIDPTEMEGVVHVSSEHRSFKPNDSFYLSFDLGSDTDVHYEPQVKEAVDISDNGTGDLHSFIDDGDEHDAAWVRVNEDHIMVWLDEKLGDEFFVYKAAKGLKLKNAKLLYEMLNKYEFTFAKKRVPNTNTMRLYVTAPE